MLVFTTSRKRFGNPETVELRRILRKRIASGEKINRKDIEKLAKKDPKAFHYFSHLADRMKS